MFNDDIIAAAGTDWYERIAEAQQKFIREILLTIEKVGNHMTLDTATKVREMIEKEC